MSVRGFTLIELILVVLLLATLGALVVPKFSMLTSSGVQASRDDVVAALFYAQQIAMARDSNTNAIRLVATANSVSVTENGVALNHAGTQYPLLLNSGVNLSPALVLDYDKLGRTAATTFSLSKSGVSASIAVSDSGYAN